MQTLNDIINGIHNSTDKGRLFELLCLYFLRHDKLHQSIYSDVWLWKDWPGSNNSPDTGIDIVARLRNSDSFCAVQCKFREDDSSISKSEIDSFLAASSKSHFSRRIIFSITGCFNKNAQDTLKGQVPPVTSLTLHDLNASSLDWSAYPDKVSYSVKKLRPHQITAVDSVIQGFNGNDRGRLIMACGTGKTFTSLKIAERLAGKWGVVLVLVPSISLLNQSILAWNYDHDENIPMRSFAVCSDQTVGRKIYPDEDLNLTDLAFHPTTNAIDLVREFKPDPDAMTVIFSTYQSLQVIHDAQNLGLPNFDIVICDEAHRTAGVTLKDKDDSYFRRVHDEQFIHARKRLYMTATPKVYGDTPEKKADLKQKAEAQNAILYDMDNTEIFGPLFHWLTFSQSVEQNLLTDYKVMVFMVAKNPNNEPDINDIIKGTCRALAKDIDPSDSDFIETDKLPMHKAVAYSSTIQRSKDFAGHFDPENYGLTFQARHIDGKDSASKRSACLQWLKDSATDCRILSNARCLCEGVDVPALDAVIFISPKSSQIDIVQSVGRVMRKAPHKKFGYVILPVIVSPGESPEYALDHNDSYKTVWKVLQALRAHDDHFKAEINSLDFGDSSQRIRVTGSREHSQALTHELAELYRREIYIRMVRKCGDREYWSSWVKDLVSAFQTLSARISEAVSTPNVKPDFDKFTEELQAVINPSVTPEQAVEMLAQHITSKEVFDAIFAGFADYNPVSLSMQKMRRLIELNGAELTTERLETFNRHIREKAESAKTGAAKQKLLREIYENFFVQAFPETARTLGIVYTPEEITDFILRSADWAVREKLGIQEGLAAQDVHILDPFSGTGTFTARLIQLGIIPAERLTAKYQSEIHANEILLLAYYISAINIEAAYNQTAGGVYTEFPGMVLSDTFRLNEGGTPYLHRMFYMNGIRAASQEKETITVIIGNPPYSVGGKDSNYTVLDGKIAESYAANSTATNRNSLYDSYIRAIRWASDRIETRGIICFVSNASFIDSNSADGMRKSLASEFTDIYIFNLRGNQRGGDWRKEGAKVFGEGSQCPIAITLFVKDGSGKPCGIHYYEAGDYLTREEKLAELVRAGSFGEMAGAGMMRELWTDRLGDWLYHVSDKYLGFLGLGGKKNDEGVIFSERYSAGVKTARDIWCWNFSREALRRNIKTLKPEALTDESLRVGLYRPYVKEYMHFSRETNNRVYQMPAIFPKPETKNMVICVSGVGSKDFSVLMTDCLPDYHATDITQSFPLFWYEEVSSSLFGSYSERRDGVSGAMLEMFRRHYGDGSITAEDVFCYVYGVLSSREYAARFGKDTRRVLARVPMVKEFRAFCDAGRELGRLHVNYERTDEWPLRLEGNADDLRITKMRIVERGGERVIRYNDWLTISGIPGEAWEYVVNGRSALEWIVERYDDRVEKASGIRNDCNAWGVEHGNERYVLELIGRVVRVSVRTMEILGSMPEFGV